jgi:spermidine synthase
LDAYYADTVPFFLTTREFFKIAAEHLNPDGVFVNNVIGSASGPKSRFFRSVYRTMDEVFAHMWAFTVPESTGRSGVMNIELFGLNAKDPARLATLRKRAAEMQGKVIKDAKLTSRVEQHIGGAVKTNDVPTLTDDYAPVDALIHLW